MCCFLHALAASGSTIGRKLFAFASEAPRDPDERVGHGFLLKLADAVLPSAARANGRSCDEAGNAGSDGGGSGSEGGGSDGSDNSGSRGHVSPKNDAQPAKHSRPTDNFGAGDGVNENETQASRLEDPPRNQSLLILLQNDLLALPKCLQRRW